MFLTTLNLAYSSTCYLFAFIFFAISLLHTVLPFGLDFGILAIGAYLFTRLRKAELQSVEKIFGPDPASDEAEKNPETVVKCIAHRGAGLDAPENTLEAFKYCVEQQCRFVEFDVRSCADGALVLLHDAGLQRLAGVDLPDVSATDWDAIKEVDIGITHPNRHKFSTVRVCLLDEALDYLIENRVRMIIDVKGEDSKVVSGILKAFEMRPQLYSLAAVTTFNPFMLYQIRKKDPGIVGAVSYRPYCFSALSYDAEKGAGTPRYGESPALQWLARGLDVVHAAMWRSSARWCGASAVLLHKDMVSPGEVQYWRARGVRCVGWPVNRPLEKLFWRGVLRAPYLAHTLLAEPPQEKKLSSIQETSLPNGKLSAEFKMADASKAIDELLAQQDKKETGSGQN